MRRSISILVGLSLATAGCGSLSLAPRVSSVSPDSGSVLGGEHVTIDGSGFIGSRAMCRRDFGVWFGRDLQHGYVIPANSYRVLSDSEISAEVPANLGAPVDVQIHDSCGTSLVTSGSQFDYVYPRTQCLSGTCSLSISSSPMGELRHSALGFLDGFDTDSHVLVSPAERALVVGLHPRQWRLGQAGLKEPGGGVFGLARRSGALVSLDLTSDWEDWAYDFDRRSYDAPYLDLAKYYSFIYSDVKSRMAVGQVPDYFDVWNEPDSTGTADQWLSVYGTAYSAVKAADPSARLVGPSIASFLIAPTPHPNRPGYDLSLTDFLNWEMRTGDRFAAISWHEDGTTVSGIAGGLGLPSHAVPGGYRDEWSPAAIGSHVLAAKALLARYPRLARTQVFVNEYGPTFAANIPGWLVGDVASLEHSGASQAMLTCPTSTACDDLLDGLLGSDGKPQMPYWVMLAYARMSGTVMQTAASGTNLYTLATRVARNGAVEALIGRADDCFGGVQCPQFHAPAAPPITLALSVAVPADARSVTVSFERLPDSARNPIGDNDVPEPKVDTLSGVPVRHGFVRLHVPSVGDGDALYVVVTPNG